MVYDLLGRTVEQINADNTSVTYAYDALGRVTQTADERGYATAWGELYNGRDKDHVNYNFYDAWNSDATLIYYHK